MGDWGTGNFDSDAAADHLSILTDRLITVMAIFENPHPVLSGGANLLG
ncbi:hypothetical protein [Streptomyces europaeiscabiei]|nr:hypothetical protein [Streptomyces europaeiscabiei]MDX3612496.1 hypothetical protein [Streptomyces europaeiscabiei]